MKMRTGSIITISIVLVISLLVFLNSIFISQPKLFPEEEIIHSNIERIEILEPLSSDSIVVENINDIKKISSFLIKLNSNPDNLSEANYIDNTAYYIYIVNIGRNGNTSIVVSKDSITYRGKTKYMTSKESSSLFKLIDEINK